MIRTKKLKKITDPDSIISKQDYNKIFDIVNIFYQNMIKNDYSDIRNLGKYSFDTSIFNDLGDNTHFNITVYKINLYIDVCLLHDSSVIIKIYFLEYADNYDDYCEIIKHYLFELYNDCIYINKIIDNDNIEVVRNILINIHDLILEAGYKVDNNISFLDCYTKYLNNKINNLDKSID